MSLGFLAGLAGVFGAGGLAAGLSATSTKDRFAQPAEHPNISSRKKIVTQPEPPGKAHTRQHAHRTPRHRPGVPLPTRTPVPTPAPSASVPTETPVEQGFDTHHRSTEAGTHQPDSHGQTQHTNIHPAAGKEATTHTDVPTIDVPEQAVAAGLPGLPPASQPSVLSTVGIARPKAGEMIGGDLSGRRSSSGMRLVQIAHASFVAENNKFNTVFG